MYKSRQIGDEGPKVIPKLVPIAAFKASDAMTVSKDVSFNFSRERSFTHRQSGVFSLAQVGGVIGVRGNNTLFFDVLSSA